MHSPCLAPGVPGTPLPLAREMSGPAVSLPDPRLIAGLENVPT